MDNNKQITNEELLKVLTEKIEKSEENLKSYVDVKINEVKGYVDVKFDEVKGYVDVKFDEVKDYVNMKTEEVKVFVKEEVDNLATLVKGEVDRVDDGLNELAERIGKLESRMERLEAEQGIIIVKLEKLEGDMDDVKLKVNEVHRLSLVTLTKRVVNLEERMKIIENNQKVPALDNA